MKYDKPRIVYLDEAVRTIQGAMKDTWTFPDSARQPNLITVSAYEADE